MDGPSVEAVTRRVFREYIAIEKSIRSAMRASDIGCPDRCGACCYSKGIETTVLELFPLMMHVLRSGKLDYVVERLNCRTELDPCVFFESWPEGERNGFCTVYRFRPLVCRMFGFSARLRKDGAREAQVCRIVRQRDPEDVSRFEALCRNATVPDMASCFMRIAGLDPQRGYRLMPFHDALRETIDYFYWRKNRYFNREIKYIRNA